MNHSPIVSVVVPTYQRPDLLDRCLEALMAQDLDPNDYEILVVDDAASQQTRQQVEAWAQKAAVYGVRPKQPQPAPVLAGYSPAPAVEDAAAGDLVRPPLSPPIRYIANKTSHGPAAARNAGWQAAHAAIISFTDDDCQPAPGWLSAGVAAIQAGADGVSGKIIMPIPPVPSDYERDAAGLAHADFVTANCFYTRELLETVQGFDPEYELAWREDSDLYFAALQHGFKLIKAPEAVVLHPVRKARWGVSIQQQRKSQFNALLYKKYPALYRQQIQSLPPWRYYVSVLAMLAAAFGWVCKKPFLALTGAATWFGFTARFAAKRLNGTRHDPTHVAEMIVTSIAIPPVNIFWRLRGAVKHRVWFL